MGQKVDADIPIEGPQFHKRMERLRGGGDIIMNNKEGAVNMIHILEQS